MSSALQFLQGFEVADCFSQQKEELIVVFQKEEKEFFIQAHFHNTFSCLFFPDDFKRARQNSVTLFQDILGLKVVKVDTALNERCIVFSLESGKSLVFKLFGNRANVILFDLDKVVKIFKNNLKLDLDLSLQNLNRSLDLSLTKFNEVNGNLNNFLPTLGKEAVAWLEQKGYEAMLLEDKWSNLTSLLSYFENPDFYIITDKKGKPAISVLPENRFLEKYDNPIKAINSFYRQYIKDLHIHTTKEELYRDIERRLKHSKAVVSDLQKRLKEIQERIPMDQTADIIMANLHAIQQGVESAILFDFYRNEEREIKLNSKLSPQKNAEVLYKKSKSRFKEVEVLENLILQRLELIQQLDADRETVREIEDSRELKTYQSKYFKTKETERERQEGPYKTYDYLGYKILVGKSAKANEELTFKTGKKDDLWLHAKDVAGSHVIIQQRPGQNYPIPVIERAASLAAFYSKRKTDSLCPVMYTQKKFVRKIKGAAPGMVKVEKETVIMVVPSGID
ncbi:NFACT RNA binding domain-containing protein [Sporocytophaga myxococcoides]|uniref:NFACT RNA binding domain-containing protein n=1 Tax=Sporocytophaga myxococcoides TaxID=153721 RepID=UPI0006941623|nr:NFACT RNA binding domain-containing protein [Sporocytophaga myxococcoides]